MLLMSGTQVTRACLIVGLVLTFHSLCRNREIKRIKGRARAGNSFAFICNDISELEHSNQVNLPRVTVIMPLKGFGEHNLHNWRTQVSFPFSLTVGTCCVAFSFMNEFPGNIPLWRSFRVSFCGGKYGGSCLQCCTALAI